MMACVQVVSAAEADLMGDWYLRNARDTTKSLDHRLAYCDSLLELTKIGHASLLPIEKVDVLILKGALHQGSMRYDEATECFSEALALLPKGEEKHLEVLLRLAVTNRAKGDLPTAITYFHRLLAMPKPDSLLYIDGSAYAFLSMIGMRTGRYDLTKKYFDRADRITDQLKTANVSKEKMEMMLCDVANAKGIFYLEVRDFPTARDNMKVALETSGDLRPRSVALVNLGLVYMLQDHADVAEEYFKEGMKALDSKYGVLLGAVNRMHIYLQQGRWNEVTELCHTYGPEIEQTTHQSLLATYFVNRAIIEEKNGNAAESLRYRNRLDSLTATETSIEQIYKLQLQLDELPQDAPAPKSATSICWIWLLGGIALLGGITALWFATRYRKQLKATATERAIWQKQLKAVEESGSDAERKYEELVKRYEQLMEDAADAETGGSEAYLERKLSLLHPTLTKNELEMCHYLLRNLSAKQIAEESHRSVRTIESIKYSIRKKLATTDSTYAYLRRIDAMTLGDVRRQLLTGSNQTE